MQLLEKYKEVFDVSSEVPASSGSYRLVDTSEINTSMKHKKRQNKLKEMQWNTRHSKLRHKRKLKAQIPKQKLRENTFLDQINGI
jgi:hypothetical protein